MNLKLFIPALFILLLGCGADSETDKTEKLETATNGTATKDDKKKKGKQLFDIKAAKIEFKYTGGPETGTEILYFDDYGAVAVLVVDKKTQYGRTNQTITWQDGKGMIIDHEKKNVVKAFFRSKATEPPSIADTPEETRKSIGYEKMPSETIAGKECEVWFNAKQNIKYWLWNKIDLKLENQKAYTKEATSVEEISGIPASILEIPKEYKQ